MIIDAHNHPDWCGYDLSKFLANMELHNIAVTWLLTWECPLDEARPTDFSVLPPLSTTVGPIPIDLGVSYAQRAPGRFVLGYAPDPRRPGAVDRLQAAVEIYGVRVCGELKTRMTYDNPDALRMFRFCGEKKLPVIVHIDYAIESEHPYPRPTWWYGGGMDALERALAACPDTVFLGHGPGFWSHISDDDQCERVAYPTGKVVRGGKIEVALRRYPNLYCDLSAGSGHGALSRDTEYAKDFVTEFQDRLLYARDCFDNTHQELLTSLGLPDAVLAKIYSGNALRLAPIAGS